MLYQVVDHVISLSFDKSQKLHLATSTNAASLLSLTHICCQRWENGSPYL